MIVFSHYHWEYLTIHRTYLVGEILVNHAGKSHWQEKNWRISNSQCIHICHVRFRVSVNIDKENFEYDLPNFPIFPVQKFSRVQYNIAGENFGGFGNSKSISQNFICQLLIS